MRGELSGEAGRVRGLSTNSVLAEAPVIRCGLRPRHPLPASGAKEKPQR